MVDQPAPDFEEARKWALAWDKYPGKGHPEEKQIAREILALLSEREAREEREQECDYHLGKIIGYANGGAEELSASWIRARAAMAREVLAALPATESAQAEQGVASVPPSHFKNLPTRPLPTEEETRP